MAAFSLAPSLEANIQGYTCQCKSCEKSLLWKPWLVRLFLGGFICPLFWMVNMYLYLRIHCWGKSDILLPLVAPNELPTQLELEKDVINMKLLHETVDDSIEEFWENSTVLGPASTSRTSLSTSEVPTEITHSDYLKEIAKTVIHSHDYFRTVFLNWFLLSLCGLAGFLVIIIFLVVLPIYYSRVLHQ
ncbi:HDL389Cp [Eremothecium sinecaudum]|uniref:HDL389Cp n=1 Tax=Eremothecium sinecaudum TaxID=45286 RepID=A0A109UYT7_9SACH|nr:HDL389Cp [Eremothecium sinecaudum]AMD20355.1 HDL389Cp [Eremothecium sinecaudum]